MKKSCRERIGNEKNIGHLNKKPSILLLLFCLFFFNGIREAAEIPVSEFTRLDEMGREYDAAAILDAGQGSVSVWVKFNKDYPRCDCTIIRSDDSRFLLSVNNCSNTAIKGGGERFGALAGNNRRVEGNAGGSPAGGNWQLVTMTWNRFPKGGVALYLNGRLLDKEAYAEWNSDDRTLPDRILAGVQAKSWPIAAGWISISDLRVYRRCLTDAGIMQLYRAGKDPAIEKDLPKTRLFLSDGNIEAIVGHDPRPLGFTVAPALAADVYQPVYANYKTASPSCSREYGHDVGSADNETGQASWTEAYPQQMNGSMPMVPFSSSYRPFTERSWGCSPGYGAQAFPNHSGHGHCRPHETDRPEDHFHRPPHDVRTNYREIAGQRVGLALPGRIEKKRSFN
jgi:hypothetical protein